MAYNENEITARIHTRLLSIFGDKNLKFRKIIDDLGCVISGSFIIESILNEEWNDNDIDIFVPYCEKNKNHLDNFLTQCYKLDNYSPTNKYVNDFGTNSKKKTITWIKNFTVNGKTVQIINTSLPKYKLNDFILSNFDFDICKNMYWIEKCACKLHVNNITNIVNKQFHWNYTNNIIRSLQRSIKYSKRGFNIIYPKNLINILSNDKFIRDICEYDKYIEIEYRSYSDHVNYIMCIDFTEENYIESIEEIKEWDVFDENKIHIEI